MSFSRELILASESPRRAMLLSQIGLPFRVVPSRISEDADVPSDPEQHVLVLSRRKAEDVAYRIEEAGLVLGADTIVVLDGEILGKPFAPEDAISMLSKLAGRTHQVFTGLTLVGERQGPVGEREDLKCGDTRAARPALSDVVSTRVRMRAASRAEIEWYVSTGEPMDKAGAYGIQGKGALFIERIEGCFYNVVGLPLLKLIMMLRTMGYDPWEDEDGT